MYIDIYIYMWGCGVARNPKPACGGFGSPRTRVRRTRNPQNITNVRIWGPGGAQPYKYNDLGIWRHPNLTFIIGCGPLNPET